MQAEDIEEALNCTKNCETGVRELLTMQMKHAEVGRLTYARNIAKCEKIHGNVLQFDQFDKETSDHQDVDTTGLAHCITHNTDKVDRRFFGYYSG